jgi:hypothetical protein
VGLGVGVAVEASVVNVLSKDVTELPVAFTETTL